MAPDLPSVAVIGCGAIARELLAIARQPGLEHLSVECLPARLHNTPWLIPDAVEQRIVAARARGSEVYVAYGDCGTGGLLDTVLEAHGVDRLSGDHCYQFFMGGATFLEEHQRHPATFYLTDYLVRNFDRLVWSGLGIDRHPQLLADYFGSYERVLYLAQVDDPSLVERARAHAARLGLGFAHRLVGYGDVEPVLLRLGGVREPAA
ncbi:MAG: DUF1638 domain-containing protein [Acidimicrobiia bacterium]|nr:MAG: DUF1638 domain-containing protein [Acidimicrobiia bacterium]